MRLHDILGNPMVKDVLAYAEYAAGVAPAHPLTGGLASLIIPPAGPFAPVAVYHTYVT